MISNIKRTRRASLEEDRGISLIFALEEIMNDPREKSFIQAEMAEAGLDVILGKVGRERK